VVQASAINRRRAAIILRGSKYNNRIRRTRLIVHRLPKDFAIENAHIADRGCHQKPEKRRFAE
jgi:hypothetical protein